MKILIKFLFWMVDAVFDIEIAIFNFFGVEHGPHPRDRIKALKAQEAEE